MLDRDELKLLIKECARESLIDLETEKNEEKNRLSVEKHKEEINFLEEKYKDKYIRDKLDRGIQYEEALRDYNKLIYNANLYSITHELMYNPMVYINNLKCLYWSGDIYNETQCEKEFSNGKLSIEEYKSKLIELRRKRLSYLVMNGVISKEIYNEALSKIEEEFLLIFNLNTLNKKPNILISPGNKITFPKSELREDSGGIVITKTILTLILVILFSYILAYNN